MMREAIHNGVIIAAFLATGIVLDDKTAERDLSDFYREAITNAASDPAGPAAELWSLRDERFLVSPDEWWRVYCARSPRAVACVKP